MMCKAQKTTCSYERVRFVEICFENFLPTPKNLRQPKNFRPLQQLGVLQHPQQYAYVCYSVYSIREWPAFD